MDLGSRGLYVLGRPLRLASMCFQALHVLSVEPLEQRYGRFRDRFSPGAVVRELHSSSRHALHGLSGARGVGGAPESSHACTFGCQEDRERRFFMLDEILDSSGACCWDLLKDLRAPTDARGYMWAMSRET